MHGRSRALLFVAALLVALGLTGCSRPVTQPSGTPAAEPATAPASIPTGSETPTAGPSENATGFSPEATKTAEPAEPTGETGKQFGYVKGTKVRQGPKPRTYLVVDYAQFLTGDAAARAAKAAGQESPPPNDYFIVNENPMLRSLPFAAGAKIGVQPTSGSTDLKAMSAEQFVAKLNAAAETDVIRYNPYWIWLKDGEITRMEQQYLP
jgi:hypothetical protein